MIVCLILCVSSIFFTLHLLPLLPIRHILGLLGNAYTVSVGCSNFISVWMVEDKQWEQIMGRKRKENIKQFIFALIKFYFVELMRRIACGNNIIRIFIANKALYREKFTLTIITHTYFCCCEKIRSTNNISLDKLVAFFRLSKQLQMINVIYSIHRQFLFSTYYTYLT